MSYGFVLRDIDREILEYLDRSASDDRTVGTHDVIQGVAGGDDRRSLIALSRIDTLISEGYIRVMSMRAEEGWAVTSKVKGVVDPTAMRWGKSWRNPQAEKIDAEEIKKNILRALDEMPSSVRIFAHDVLISLRLMGGDMRAVRQREIADCLLDLIDAGRVRMIYDDYLADPPAFELVEKKSVK